MSPIFSSGISVIQASATPLAVETWKRGPTFSPSGPAQDSGRLVVVAPVSTRKVTRWPLISPSST